MVKNQYIGHSYYPWCMVINIWFVVDLPLWKIWVSWDDEIPQLMGKTKLMFQTTNQKNGWQLGVFDPMTKRKPVKMSNDGCLLSVSMKWPALNTACNRWIHSGRLSGSKGISGRSGEVTAAWMKVGCSGRWKTWPWIACCNVLRSSAFSNVSKCGISRRIPLLMTSLKA